MISRRNIRVKVMQTLYTVATLENEVKPGDPQKILQKHFELTRELFIYLTYFLTEICRYAEAHSQQRAGKHLPTYEDLHVNTKIAGNLALWKILDDASFKKAMAQVKPGSMIDRELVKKIYLQMVETPEYKTYINKSNRDYKDEKELLEFILDKLMLANEIFLSHIE